MSETVKIDRRGRIGLIIVDNPPVNALSHAVRDSVCTALDDLEKDEAIRAIVLHCAGRTFFAGADIREFGKPPQDPSLRDMLARLECCDKPVVAALHGTALGGGLETALCCHYRIANNKARVGTPEVNLGLLPGAGGTQRLPRLCGAEAALDLMIGGKPINAQRALDLGIVDVLTDDGFPDAAVVYAEQLVEDGAAPLRISERDTDPVAQGFFGAYRKKIARRTRGFEAPECIVQAVEAAMSRSFDEGMRIEREFFEQCRDATQSAAMRHLFFAEREVASIPGVAKDTSVRDIEQLAVIGAGTMGAGIALACLNSGLSVHLLDSSFDGLERGRRSIEKLLREAVAKGRITDDQMKDRLSRLALVSDYKDIEDAELVIEAVFESMAVKEEVFSSLDRHCRKGTILATNTSTLDVDRIAAATDRPEDVIGLHFFSPANIMKLLEIVRGEKTSAEVIASSMKFAKVIGKIGVLVGNCFGFVGNRMLYGYGRENHLMLLEGAAPEYIDKTLYDWGMAMGPNAVGDLAGLDVGYKVRQERSDLPHDPRFYRMADVLVEQGRYGQKSGRGMYLYQDGSRTPTPDPDVTEMIRLEAIEMGVKQRKCGPDEIIERCIYALIVEGARILDEGLALRASDIDVVWANGYGFPRYRGGPMFYADTVGLDKIYDAVCRIRDSYKGNELGDIYWKPPALLEELARNGGSFAGLDKGSKD